MITSFLLHKLDRALSLERTITAGLAHGNVLGPMLFSVYITSMPKLPETQLVMFADDMGVYVVDHNMEMVVIWLQD